MLKFYKVKVLNGLLRAACNVNEVIQGCTVLELLGGHTSEQSI
jgi:hypothetical protein